MIEVLIRENGGEPRWIDIKDLRNMTKTKPKVSAPPQSLDLNDFNNWWELYDYKKGKAKAIKSWQRHVRKKLINHIMLHTSKYVDATPEKQYRMHPTTYLNGHCWNDEITIKDKKIDLDIDYPFDTTGNSRKGRCSACDKVVFGHRFTIHKDDSDCCKAKINKYR